MAFVCFVMRMQQGNALTLDIGGLDRSRDLLLCLGELVEVDSVHVPVLVTDALAALCEEDHVVVHSITGGAEFEKHETHSSVPPTYIRGVEVSGS